MLRGKKILIGVTGSIAAYKAAIIIRLLIKEGAEVKVVMTKLAKEFITPLTLATLAKNPVLADFFNPENGEWNNHVNIGTWADACLIAPATANTMAKMAQGIADNLLLTTYLSARSKVFVAPAMDLDMYKHAATQENIEVLKQRDNVIIEPETGELASGLDGKGRMAEPEKILQTLKDFFSADISEKKKPLDKLDGRKILITAGPTYEPIDPVRFIGNHSSGKMGFALAEAFASYGAEVILISGPVFLTPSPRIARYISVDTADQMYEACLQVFSDCDIAVFSAAVGDYKPGYVSGQKIKSAANELDMRLIKTTDIAFELGKIKREDQLTVGFALETEKEQLNAKEKLKKKNMDVIVLNSLNDKGAGFGYDTNKISVIDKHNKIYNFELKSKSEVALDILGIICDLPSVFSKS